MKMAIELDMEKILNQPNDEEKLSELTKQIFNAVQAFDPHNPISTHVDALIGFISGLVMNLMLVREYCDFITGGFNQYADAMHQLTDRRAPPVTLLNFGDFSDTHDMTPEQMKEWLAQRNEKWRERKEAAKGKIISLGN